MDVLTQDCHQLYKNSLENADAIITSLACNDSLNRQVRFSCSIMNCFPPFFKKILFYSHLFLDIAKTLKTK